MAKAFWNFTRVRQLACSVYARGTSVPMFLLVTDGDLSLVWIAHALGAVRQTGAQRRGERPVGLQLATRS